MIGSKLRRAAILAPMTFVIIVVNYWIYRVRADFIDRHPLIAARKPPTISRAISDPAIGEPFAFWISLSAILLVAAFIPICRLYWRSGIAMATTEPKTGAILKLGAAALLAGQFITAIGMVILSHYTFPDFHREHMIGSFIFFIGQSVSIGLVGCMCWRIAFGKAARRILPRSQTLDPTVSRIRAPLALAVVGAALLYLLLFVLKGLDLPFSGAIYQAYVILEPALISLFLAVLSTFYPDIFRADRRRECGLAASAWRKRA